MGQSTDWVELKAVGQEQLGRVLVSISREALESEGDYTHVVQNTEECQHMGGDQDDPYPDQYFDESDQSQQLDEHLQESHELDQSVLVKQYTNYMQ